MIFHRALLVVLFSFIAVQSAFAERLAVDIFRAESTDRVHLRGFRPELAGGVHVVGNGGGFAEMQAVYFHQELGRIIGVCAASNDPCRLGASVASDFAALVRAHEQEVKSVKISFSPVLAGDLIFATERRLGAEIQFSNTHLYEADGAEKSAQDVLALVLAARWSHVNALMPIEDLVRISQTFARMVRIDSKSSRIATSHDKLALHDITLSLKSGSRHALFLEDERMTRDLSLMLEKELPCGTLNDWTVQNLQGSEYPGQFIFKARMQSTCSEDPYFLQIQGVAPTTGEVDLEQLKIFLKPGF